MPSSSVDNMKKVVLLGDSIRLIGYGKTVESRLSGDFEVWQPLENCRFAKHTLRGLYDWRDELCGADIIHWNNGLWDTWDVFGDGPFSSVEEFTENMLRLARLLKARAKVVIFATITPVRYGGSSDGNKIIEEYNAAIVPKLREMGVVINDLYSAMLPDVDKYVSDDRVHLSAEGIAFTADIIEDIIRREAEKLG